MSIVSYPFASLSRDERGSGVIGNRQDLNCVLGKPRLRRVGSEEIHAWSAGRPKALLYGLIG